MNKVNVKLFAILLAAGVVLAGGLLVLHALQSGRIADALLWQARRAEEQGDLKKAAQYLQRYLEFEPEDQGERAHLGRVLADPKLASNYQAREQALFVLEQVVARDAGRHDLRRPLVRVATELEQFDAAGAHLDVLEKNFPKDGQVQYLRARWYEAQKKDDEAEGCLDRAVALAPRQTRYAVRLVNLLRRRLDRLAPADRPGEAAKKAEDLLARALRRAPRDADVLLAAAGLAHSLGDPAKAEGFLARGLRLYPKNPRFYELQANLQIRENKRDLAIVRLQEGLKKVPGKNDINLLWTLANLLLDDIKPADPGPGLKKAAAQIAKLRQADCLPDWVTFLEARLDIARGDWARAARSLERIRPKLEKEKAISAQVNLYLGRCYVELDEPRGRLLAYQRAVKNDPTAVVAYTGLAAAQLALGDGEGALKTYQKLRTVEGAPFSAWTETVRLLLARERRQKGRPPAAVDKALAEAERKQRRAPEDQKERQEIDWNLLRADVLTARNQVARAEKLLEEAAREKPAVEYQTALIALAENQGDVAKAGQLLDDAEKRFPDQVEVMLARARFLVNRDGVGARAALASLARGLDGLKAPERVTVLTGLAEASYRIGAQAQSAALLARVARERPKDLLTRLRLFDLYQRIGNAAGVDRVLGEIKRIEGSQGTWWQYGRATQLIDLAKKGARDRDRLLTEAQRLLTEVAARKSHWSAVPLAKARIEELRGNEVQAQTYYQEAMNLREKDQRVVSQLVEEGRFLAARGERSAEAERKLRRATRVAGRVSETWVSLVKYLAATGQRGKARETIAEARKYLSESRSDRREVTLGRCYEAVGDVREAEKCFRFLLQRSGADVASARAVASFYMRVGRAEKAEPLLRDIVDGKIKAADADVAWARRGLAMVLATGGSYPRFKEALRLVGLRLEDDGQLREDRKEPLGERDETQRARARVLAAQTGRAFRRKSIALLEDLSKRQKLEPDDQYLLAQLYEAGGRENWPRVEKLLRALAARPAQDPLHLAHFAQGLLLHRKFQEAADCIKKLEALEQMRRVPAGGYGSVELRARALELKGDYAGALALLKKFASGDRARPEPILVYAGYLARRRRLDDALDQCQRAWRVGPPEMVGGACLALLRTTEPSPAQCRRVGAWLDAAIARDDKSIVLQVQKADLLDLWGKYPQAEALYRKVLGRNPTNGMALNNLAWLLAERKHNGKAALPLIAKAIELYGPKAELLDTRATVYLAMGRSQEAIADLRKALEDGPSAGRYFHLSRAYLKARQPEEALKAFRLAKAAGLEPKGLHPVERLAYREVAEKLDQK
jgi:tetratricopeptide (TPR) repeat protein